MSFTRQNQNQASFGSTPTTQYGPNPPASVSYGNPVLDIPNTRLLYPQGPPPQNFPQPQYQDSNHQNQQQNFFSTTPSPAQWTPAAVQNQSRQPVGPVTTPFSTPVPSLGTVQPAPHVAPTVPDVTPKKRRRNEPRSQQPTSSRLNRNYRFNRNRNTWRGMTPRQAVYPDAVAYMNQNTHYGNSFLMYGRRTLGIYQPYARVCFRAAIQEAMFGFNELNSYSLEEFRSRLATSHAATHTPLAGLTVQKVSWYNDPRRDDKSKFIGTYINDFIMRSVTAQERLPCEHIQNRIMDLIQQYASAESNHVMDHTWFPAHGDLTKETVESVTSEPDFEKLLAMTVRPNNLRTPVYDINGVYACSPSGTALHPAYDAQIRTTSIRDTVTGQTLSQTVVGTHILYQTTAHVTNVPSPGFFTTTPGRTPFVLTMDERRDIIYIPISREFNFVCGLNLTHGQKQCPPIEGDAVRQIYEWNISERTVDTITPPAAFIEYGGREMLEIVPEDYEQSNLDHADWWSLGPDGTFSIALRNVDVTELPDEDKFSSDLLNPMTPLAKNYQQAVTWNVKTVSGDQVVLWFNALKEAGFPVSGAHSSKLCSVRVHTNNVRKPKAQIVASIPKINIGMNIKR